MAEQRARPPRPPARRAGPRTQHISSAEEAVDRAADTVAKLIDHPVEGCSEVSPADDHGWRVCVDVREVARIPDTTTLLATYEVELDQDGSLRRYRRVRRYRRGAADT